jgi:hypothetical protein
MPVQSETALASFNVPYFDGLVFARSGDHGTGSCVIGPHVLPPESIDLRAVALQRLNTLVGVRAPQE